MRSIKRAAAATALAATALAGGAIGASLIGTAGAQTSGSSSTTAPAPAQGSQPGGGQFDPTKGGHVGQNGTREELLTGDTADKVRAAALAAVPGGTVQRVETDAEGSPYEAHMTKSDGTRVTVKVGSDFRVTNIENDAAGHGPGGPPPAAASSTSA
jgi:hypothetical protein